MPQKDEGWLLTAARWSLWPAVPVGATLLGLVPGGGAFSAILFLAAFLVGALSLIRPVLGVQSRLAGAATLSAFFFGIVVVGGNTQHHEQLERARLEREDPDAYAALVASEEAEKKAEADAAAELERQREAKRGRRTSEDKRASENQMYAARFACENAIIAAASYKVVKKPSNGQFVRMGDEFAVTWERGDIVLQNGFGAEVPTAAVCMGRLDTCKIVMLLVNDEAVVNEPIPYECN